MSALERPIICAVTAGAGAGESSFARMTAAIDAGVDLLQVRERALSDRDLFALVGRVVARARGTGTRVIVNERTDVALAAGAAGVHLRGDSVPASRVREIAPAGFLIGRSVHSTAEAAAAAADGGCDYLVFGTVFPSAGKPGHEAAGLDALAAVARRVPLPVLAIGGITLERIAPVAAAGAAGFAAIGLFGGAIPARDVVLAARKTFDT